MVNIFIFIIFFLFLILYQGKSQLIGEKLGLQDSPGENKIHKKNTALIGGFPVVFFVIIFMIFNYSNLEETLIFIISISIIFFLIGLVDDKINLNPYLKLFLSLIIFLISIFFLKI